MLDLKCDRCGRELKEPGALAFSPPKDDGWLVEKYHLCVDCWQAIREQLRNFKQSPDRKGR